MRSSRPSAFFMPANRPSNVASKSALEPDGTMHTHHVDIPAGVYLLADHLLRVTDAGRDLTALSLTVTEPSPGTGPRMLRQREARLAQLVRDARSLEASIVAHVLQARRRASELGRVGGTLKLLLTPFMAGTRPLLDAAADYGDPASRAFHSGSDSLAFARSRGLIGAEQATLMPIAKLDVDDGFLIAGRVAVGPLLELIEAFLRALDTHYGLWPERADAVAYEPVAEQRNLPLAVAGMDLSRQIAEARALVTSMSLQDDIPEHEPPDQSMTREARASNDVPTHVRSLRAALDDLDRAALPAE